jgi:zinc D-Ala-D-Ala carboxypeptidase
VDNTGSPKVPKRLSEYSSSQHDDLPQAYREAQPAPRKSKKPLLRILGLILTAFVLGTLPALWLNYRSNPVATSPSPVRPSTTAAAIASPTAPNAAVPNTSPNTLPNSTATSPPDQLLGHYRYAEAAPGDLESIGGDIKMHKAAAAKFMAMSDAAQADGVSLVPLSGFRSVDDQNHLFFDVKAERGQNTNTRADVSAPPGYSEHHTGYAVDIGDSSQSDTNLSQSFEQTEAFKWLQKNAAYYSFELSFYKGNPEGVSYEPWHWRYVGDRKSLEIFYRARKK